MLGSLATEARHTVIPMVFRKISILPDHHLRGEVDCKRMQEMHLFVKQRRGVPKLSQVCEWRYSFWKWQTTCHELNFSINIYQPQILNPLPKLSKIISTSHFAGWICWKPRTLPQSEDCQWLWAWHCIRWMTSDGHGGTGENMVKTWLNTRAGIVGYRLLLGAAKGLNIVGIPTVERVSCLVSICLNYTSIMRSHHTKSYLFTLSFQVFVDWWFPPYKGLPSRNNRQQKFQVY